MKKLLSYLGPGVIVAATGVGAGDMIAASKASSIYGNSILWAMALGAVLKYFLNEGVARFQIATQKTILEGWLERLGAPGRIYFISYLYIWAFVVAGALIAGCGLAAHSLFPSISTQTFGIIHSIIGAIIVLYYNYQKFENVMKILIALMFLVFIGLALYSSPIERILIEPIINLKIPEGSSGLLLGVIGGVGGTLTLLSYSYWIKEKGWNKKTDLKKIQMDLIIAYLLTGLFGVSLGILGHEVLYLNELKVSGNQGVITLSKMFSTYLGHFGETIFVLGFWAACFSSLLGVWQSVPTIYCDYKRIIFEKNGLSQKITNIFDRKNKYYHYFLFYLSIPPCLLLFFDKPIGVIIVYSIIGSIFMPFLASTLIWFNGKSTIVGELKSSRTTQVILIFNMILFLILAVKSILKV